ncbi:hypothetical protein F2Q69_00045231 [Brassica cretica]|uniref:Uncharacterized protein n=1 Tax=Brassica cretica TaxID=69181 RepID=A0A8S9NH97_BRACR|nr:hypothetical protein F2Q69_00045231 [Brassica cretica]
MEHISLRCRQLEVPTRTLYHKTNNVYFKSQSGMTITSRMLFLIDKYIMDKDIQQASASASFLSKKSLRTEDQMRFLHISVSETSRG